MFCETISGWGKCCEDSVWTLWDSFGKSYRDCPSVLLSSYPLSYYVHSTAHGDCLHSGTHDWECLGEVCETACGHLWGLCDTVSFFFHRLAALPVSIADAPPLGVHMPTRGMFFWNICLGFLLSYPSSYFLPPSSLLSFLAVGD